MSNIKCTCCGQECFKDSHPEIVFIDSKNVICEECSCNYELDNDGKIIVRKDLEDTYTIPLNTTETIESIEAFCRIAIIPDLRNYGITLDDISEELTYRENAGVSDEEVHCGWNDVLYYYSANELAEAERLWNDCEDTHLSSYNMQKLTYEQLISAMRRFYTEGEKRTGVIVISEDSFYEDYSLRSRSYRVNSDCKLFQPDAIANSVFGSALDGSDNNVRLDRYIQGIAGDWIVDYCYLEAKKVTAEDFAMFSILNPEKVIRFTKNGDKITSICSFECVDGIIRVVDYNIVHWTLTLDEIAKLDGDTLIEKLINHYSNIPDSHVFVTDNIGDKEIEQIVMDTDSTYFLDGIIDLESLPDGSYWYGMNN